MRAFSSPTVKALCVPGGASFPRSRLDALVEQAKRAGAAGLAWFRVVAADTRRPGRGPRFAARPLPLRRRARPPSCGKTSALEGDLILVVSDEYRTACTVLGTLRATLGSPPVGEGPHRYVWVVDFPMFDGVDAAGQSPGGPPPLHHALRRRPAPAATPIPPPCARRPTTSSSTAGSSGSGSVRIHRSDIQSQVFDLWASPPKRPRPGSASCSAPSATAPRPTPGSPSASTAWPPSWPARRTSAR